MKYVDVAEAQTIFLQLLEDVLNGEEIIFTRDSQPIAKFTRIERDDEELRYGSAKGLMTMREDFDDAIEDFKDYT